MSFAGFPPEALTFYAGLEDDNSKAYWQAHRDVYEDAVREPMELLVEELSGEFGVAKVFRPYRNLRFSKDKTPYKIGQGAVLAHDGAQAGLHYVEINAHGLRLGGGRYHLERDELARIRQAIDAGDELARIKAELERQGLTYIQPELKTAPRGYPKDHPRIELLRCKRHAAFKAFAPEPWLHTAQAKDRIAEVWRTITPLLRWLERR